MFMEVDETTVDYSVSPNKQAVQLSMPTEVPPTQHAPTTSTNDMELLERKIDDLRTKVGDLTMIVCAIMQHLGVEVSLGQFIFFMLLIYVFKVMGLEFMVQGLGLLQNQFNFMHFCHSQ